MELRVKEVCKAKGISITELAKQMGIKQESLSRAINGNPTIQTLEKIAEALGVSIVELFEVKRGDFMALIDNAGDLHRFDNIEALTVYIETIK